jgi:high-affinity iron transporter
MACAASWACLSRCGEKQPTTEVPWDRLKNPAVRAKGEVLYRENCVLCHGEHADGRGARVMGLSTKPANFTESLWSTPEGARRAFEAITNGVPGTAMPSWSTLAAEDRWALVAYLGSVSEHGPGAPAGR